MQPSTEPDSNSTPVSLEIEARTKFFSSNGIPITYNNRVLESDSKIDSHEWEWDNFSDVTEDIEVDIIHTYAPMPDERQGSRSRSFEFGPQHIYEARENEQHCYEIGNSKESTIIDLTHITNNFDNVSIMTLTAMELNPPDDPLPLIHLELIDWEQPGQLNITIFTDDDTIVQYLCSVNLETCSTSESHKELLNQESSKSLSRKNKIKN